MKKSGITSTLNFSYPCMVVSSTEWRERPVRCILSHSSSRRLLIRLYLHLSPFQPSYRSLTVSPFIPLFLFMSVRPSICPSIPLSWFFCRCFYRRVIYASPSPYINFSLCLFVWMSLPSSVPLSLCLCPS